MTLVRSTLTATLVGLALLFASTSAVAAPLASSLVDDDDTSKSFTELLEEDLQAPEAAADARSDTASPAEASAVGFIAGGLGAGGALLLSTGMLVNVLVVTVSAGSFGFNPSPAMQTFVTASLIGTPFLLLALAAVPPTVVAAALFGWDAGWLSLVAAAATVVVATGALVPVAAFGSLLLGMWPALLYSGDTRTPLGLAGLYTLAIGGIAGAAAVHAVGAGLVIGGLTAAAAAGGAALGEALE